MTPFIDPVVLVTIVAVLWLLSMCAVPVVSVWLWHRRRVAAARNDRVGVHEPWCDHKEHPQVGLAGGVRWRCYRCLAWMEPEPSFWTKFRRANGLQRH